MNPPHTRLWSRRRLLISASSLFSASTLLHSQQDVTFSTDVKVVNVLVTVLNRGGELIRDLAKDDFSIFEAGRPQTIRYFARESDLPLTIGLLVDTSMSQRRVLDAERGASFRFLDQVLRESKDRMFLMQFDMAVRIRLGLTSSRKELDEALAFVDTPTRRELMNQYGGGTLLFDAIVTASKDFMKGQTGRKALIVLSDGVDTGSDATLNDAVDAAQRADTLIYSILFSDSRVYTRDGRGALSRLSKETGGGFHEVSKKQTIEQIFDGIQQELRSQYNLGYVSDLPVRVSEFRKIQVTTKQKGLAVQSRDKYWAQR
ncbi:MAG TPA: VWA domain-containing protein [Bryobacteraceae bacterium]|nr:VWA domain-containing protein [Bryobacteraceae bacterium]